MSEYRALSRRLVLGSVAAVGLTAACRRAPEPGPTPSTSPDTTTPALTPTPTPTHTPTPTPTPSGRFAELTLEQQVGQLMMMGVNSSGATADQLDLVTRLGVGAVVLMGNTEQGVEGTRTVTDQLRQALDPDLPTLLVATDQEGGLVRRLRGVGFDEMPAAATQATWSLDKLTDRATTWGEQLRKAGVDSPLAPVADVVPPEIGNANEPIAANNRGYGDDPDEVSDRIEAVVSGFRDGGVATALKHFPGLGRVIGNTDFKTDVVDDKTGPDDPLMSSFTAGIAAGSDMVMMSTARYTLLDNSGPAAFSRKIITDFLRGELGFDRVVISDDLGVAKQVGFIAPGERAFRFLSAGGDLVINVDPSTTKAMIDGVVAAAKKDDSFAEQIAEKVQRVLTMKADRGLID